MKRLKKYHFKSVKEREHRATKKKRKEIQFRAKKNDAILPILTRKKTENQNKLWNTEIKLSYFGLILERKQNTSWNINFERGFKRPKFSFCCHYFSFHVWQFNFFYFHRNFYELLFSIFASNYSLSNLDMNSSIKFHFETAKFILNEIKPD